MPTKQSRLGELLIQRGVINRQQLEAAMQEQARTGKRLGQALVHLGYASEKTILTSLTQGIDPNISSSDTSDKKSALVIYGSSAAAIILLLVAIFSVFKGKEQPAPQSSLLAAANQSLRQQEAENQVQSEMPVENSDEIASKLVAYSSPQRVIEYEETDVATEAPESLTENSAPDSYVNTEISEPVVDDYSFSDTSDEIEPAVEETLSAEDFAFNSDNDDSYTGDLSFSNDDYDYSEPDTEIEADLEQQELSVADSYSSSSDVTDNYEEAVNDYSNGYSLQQDNTIEKLVGIRFSATDSRMQVVFEAKSSIKPFVLRTYENAYDVIYEFLNVSASQIDIPDLVNSKWLARSAFSEEGGVLTWRFRMKHKGSAKYSELEPNASNDNYRFVVIIRTTQ